jgi:hypothetical protein
VAAVVHVVAAVRDVEARDDFGEVKQFGIAPVTANEWASRLASTASRLLLPAGGWGIGTGESSVPAEASAARGTSRDAAGGPVATFAPATPVALHGVISTMLDSGGTDTGPP